MTASAVSKGNFTCQGAGVVSDLVLGDIELSLVRGLVADGGASSDWRNGESDVDSGDRYIIHLQLEGSNIIMEAGRRCELYPGELVFRSARRGCIVPVAFPQSYFTVDIPRCFLRLTGREINTVPAKKLSSSKGLGKVVVPLFQRLAENITELSKGRGTFLVRSAVDLAAVAMMEQYGNAREDSTDSSAIFRKAVNYIESHLPDPGLSPSTVAGELFISVRSLHSHFAAQNLTVSSYIRDRRLLGIRDDLVDPRYRGETVRSISARYGLFDASYVSKAFREAYGESPRSYSRRNAK